MEFKLSLRQTVEQYGLMAKKSLGQNFLLDRNITDKIIRLSLEKQNMADFSGRHVFEIGPGPGGLTRSILEANPADLTVIEMDNRCLAIMEDLKEQSLVPLNIVHGDALQIGLEGLGSAPRQVISNLPYNISVPLLIKWLHGMAAFEALTLMFQKEVADRIMAPVKTKNYGRISVLAQLVCRVEKLFDISPECFVPAPKIWSAVLLFRIRRDNLTEQNRLLPKVETLTSLAFGQRRKMIRQSLKPVPNIEAACCRAGIAMTARAEELSPEQYMELARQLDAGETAG